MDRQYGNLLYFDLYFNTYAAQNVYHTISISAPLPSTTWPICWLNKYLKDECPVNALLAQNVAGGHFLGHEIRFVFVSLNIWPILGIN